MAKINHFFTKIINTKSTQIETQITQIQLYHIRVIYKIYVVNNQQHTMAIVNFIVIKYDNTDKK